MYERIVDRSRRTERWDTWLAGQKRSSCKSRGPTDNLQKKGPEVHKASLRQQTYPEVGFAFATFIVIGGIRQSRAAAWSVACKLSPMAPLISRSRVQRGATNAQQMPCMMCFYFFQIDSAVCVAHNDRSMPVKCPFCVDHPRESVQPGQQHVSELQGRPGQSRRHGFQAPITWPSAYRQGTGEQAVFSIRGTRQNMS